MSGHSKWSTIKRKKEKADAQRGKLFSKLIREITVAARTGGGDPEGNPRLRTAIQVARGENMPAKNIESAIKKGTGEIPGVTYEETSYEGYGPGGVAILMEVLTDNRNRTIAEIRNLLSKHGGSLGENGCVAWLFEKKGLVTIEGSGTDEETVLETALEAGADDVVSEGSQYTIYTAPDLLDAVRRALVDRGVEPLVAEVTRIPQNTVRLDETKARRFLRLLEALEDQDDMQNVYSNFDIPDEVLAEIGRL